VLQGASLPSSSAPLLRSSLVELLTLALKRCRALGEACCLTLLSGGTGGSASGSSTSSAAVALLDAGVAEIEEGGGERGILAGAEILGFVVRVVPNWRAISLSPKPMDALCATCNSRGLKLVFVNTLLGLSMARALDSEAVKAGKIMSSKRISSSVKFSRRLSRQMRMSPMLWPRCQA
jgi:hypothetical protein